MPNPQKGQELKDAVQRVALVQQKLVEMRQSLDDFQSKNGYLLRYAREQERRKKDSFRWVHYIQLRRGTSSTPLKGLSSVNDLLPSPALRKRLKKMMADQAVHIDDLQRAGRFKAARWNAWCTWALWFWYVLKSPVSSLLSVAKRSIS